MRHLPSDWSGSVPAIKAFLHEKEKRFADRYEVPLHANTMRETLTALVDRLATSATTELSWPAALETVRESVVGLDRVQASQYLEWLVREGLLIDDAPRETLSSTEGTLRPAFERLGDFLVADAILSNSEDVPLELGPWIKTIEDIEQHSGMLGILSALLPERRGGRELPDMAADRERSLALLALTVDSLPSRSVAACSERTRDLVRRALGEADISSRTMASLVAIAWRRSPVDAHWLHELLCATPLAERDADWCSFLHESFAAEGVVAQLIDAAFELSLGELDPSVTERWAKLLTWFTAAADRRVKDRATRAAVHVFAHVPIIVPKLVDEMLSIDDDAVRERFLLAVYGALLHTPYSDTLKDVVCVLHFRYTSNASRFASALIRDHIRAICDLAAHRGVLHTKIDPTFASKPINRAWPLPLPSDDDAAAWSTSIRFLPDDRGDFFAYAMRCLRHWEEGMSRPDMAQWMLQTIAKDYQFVGSGCESYDRQVVEEYGGGRGRPMWAERIGKKYMWMAMHQLASHLHDNVVTKRVRTLLILAEGRQLDPSLPRCRDQSKEHQYFPATRINTQYALRDKGWIVRKDDVPKVSELVEVQTANSQDWRPLVAYLNSGTPKDQRCYAYREMFLFGYLVPAANADLLFERLAGLSFDGGWMPEGLRLGDEKGFVAEYPWATSFNTIPDHFSHAGDDGLLKDFVPAWNELSCEWEYDGTTWKGGAPSSTHNTLAERLLVPARLFFGGGDLWWDGLGGYRDVDDRVVFLDPSLGQSGPSTLVADAKDLGTRLRKVDRCLIWTLWGAKRMIDGSSGQHDFRTFSQVSYMNLDGIVKESDMVFFDSAGKPV